MFIHRLTKISVLGAVVCAAVAESRVHQLPLIDLDYAVHRPTFDAENDLYAYKNIRYADPPLGDRRFRHPARVTTVNRTINDGHYGFGCNQGYPAIVVEELSKAGESLEEARLRLTNNPAWNEDCLFLNVVVPKLVLEKAQSKPRVPNSCANGKGAPVAVWIYGGANLMGFKDQSDYDPVGLIARSREDGGDGMIHVAINYRLGLFGFVHGGDDERIDPNAGLLDQRLALQWVKANIHRFGGDPGRVTVMGQSAGAADIMFHLTAEGGKAETLFQNAIIQSPGYSTRDFYNAWNVTLDVATRITDQTITSGLELAALSPEDLREINSIAVYEVGLPTGPYGPLPDSAYVPDWPGALMLRGQFDYTPNIIVGHTANETLSYLPEGIEEVMDLETAIGSLIGPLSEETTNYVLQELYPPPDQTNLYNSAYGRILYLSTDLGFACYARQVSAAYGNETWNYQFDVKPASHSQDLLYHFYGNADSEEAGVDVEAALALQTYWTQLVLKGTVATDHSERPDWKFYGDDKTVLRFVKGGAILAKDDPGAAERCLFWQKVASGEVS